MNIAVHIVVSPQMRIASTNLLFLVLAYVYAECESLVLVSPSSVKCSSAIIIGESTFCGRQRCGKYKVHSRLIKSTLTCQRSAKCRDQMTMKVRVGILGLPNVGKSSLFNALATKQRKDVSAPAPAEVANYPFCTIDPNHAILPFYDRHNHLELLGQQNNSQKTIPATMEWIDVAGLAKNAHRGEGLGNQFLATLRECDTLCHVVRTFEDTSTTHVSGEVNPCNDIDDIHLELLLADLSHVQRRLERIGGSKKRINSNRSRNEDDLEFVTLETVCQGLQEGKPARSIGLSSEEKFSIKSMGLLTLKPIFYAFNVDEVDYTLGRDEASQAAESIIDQILESSSDQDQPTSTKPPWTLVSAKLDSELAAMSQEEQSEYWSSMLGDDSPSLSNTFQGCHEVLPSMVQDILNLGVVYTGPGVPQERSRTTKAHLFRFGSPNVSNNALLTANDLAGRLHGDIQKGFIRAEVCPAQELLQHANYVTAKDMGCIRTEGREYALQPDDVILVKWK